jgi:endo-1,4-beta-mannosidase
VDYDDVVVLDKKAYFIRHNAKEGRFGVEDEVKHWVKSAIDLQDGSRKIIKLVFYERFMSHIADIEFECFRSPSKEARILQLVAGHQNFMQGTAVRDEKKNIIRILDFIQGKTLASYIGNLSMDYETYYHEYLPDILKNFSVSRRQGRFAAARPETAQPSMP